MKDLTLMQALHYVKVSGMLSNVDDKHFVYKILVGSRGDENAVSSFLRGE